MTLHQAILNILEDHIGRSNRISRKLLCNKVGYILTYGLGPYPSDRKIRQTIEELRRNHAKGALICSTSGLSGYWIAESFEEILENYSEERRRAINTMVTIRNRLRRGRIHFDGQLNLF